MREETRILEPIKPVVRPTVSLKRSVNVQQKAVQPPAATSDLGRDLFTYSDPHVGLSVSPQRDTKEFPVQVPLFQVQAGDLRGELTRVAGQKGGAVTFGLSKGPADSTLNLDGVFIQVRHRFQRLDLQGLGGAQITSGGRTEIRAGVEGIEPELALENGKVSVSGFNLERGWARDHLEQFAKDRPWLAVAAGTVAAGATVGIVHGIAKETKTPISLPIAVDVYHNGPLTLGAKTFFYFPGDARVLRVNGGEARTELTFERARIRAAAGYVKEDGKQGFSGRVTAEVPIPHGFVGAYAGHDPKQGTQVGAGLSLAY